MNPLFPALFICAAVFAQIPPEQVALPPNGLPKGVLPLGLPEAPKPQEARAGTVSARRLAHRVPKEAQRLFELGEKAFNQSRLDEAMRFMEGAARLDPEYWDAHAKLSYWYYFQGDFESSLRHMDASLRIDPSSEELQSNKAVALLDLGRPAEAEAAGRAALRLDPSSAIGHYIVGLAMLRQEIITEETAEHFEAAVGKVPQAEGIVNRLREYVSARDQGESAASQEK